MTRDTEDTGVEATGMTDAERLAERLEAWLDDPSRPITPATVRDIIGYLRALTGPPSPPPQTAAPVSREQLVSIEWSAESWEGAWSCPACLGMRNGGETEHGEPIPAGHNPGCWIAAALSAAPPAPPPLIPNVDFCAHLDTMACPHCMKQIPAVPPPTVAAPAPTGAPRLYCASCGATDFQRLYKGGGQDWLHDADEEGSAACGPVLAAEAAPPAPTPALSIIEDIRVMVEACERERAAPAPTLVKSHAQPVGHRCSGCGHRWEGRLVGPELCGDCWRKVRPILHGEAAPPAPVIAQVLDALESDATREQRRAAFEALRDEFYPEAAPPAPTPEPEDPDR